MQGIVHHSATTRSDTRAVTIDAHPDLVFSFLADPENLPRWAVGFCRSIREDPNGSRWIASTASGDVPIAYVTDTRLGTIDFHFEPAPGQEAMAFSRVVPNGEGSEYIFTQFQMRGMPDDVFTGQVRALAEELQVLRSLIRARASCPA